MRIVLRSLLVAVVVPIAAWLVLVGLHNRPQPPPSDAEIRAGRDAAAQWLLSHREQVLSQSNIFLWWMVARSVDLVPDPRIAALLAEFRRRLRLDGQESALHVLVDPGFRPLTGTLVDLLGRNGDADYVALASWGASCNAEIGALAVVQAQLDADFCPRVHPLSPACRTHQLIGVQLARRNRCGDPARLDALSARLLDAISRALTWDPRRVDVTLQRMLVLADTRGPGALRTSWVQGALDARTADGGWGNFHPLVPLPGGRSLGLSHRGIAIQEPRASFHATAQALLLFSLLGK